MSFLQCPASPTYRTSAEHKLLSRNAARQHKFGSPKLRDLLREKCRTRVREARRVSFDSGRETTTAGQNSLVSKILRQELAQLESDLNLQEHIYRELIGEMNLWYADQLEEEEDYLIEVGNADIVFCPVCQKSGLEQSIDQQLVCQCGVSGTLENLYEAMQITIGQHEMQCNQVLNFFVEQHPSVDQKTLNAMCEACDFFVSLT